MPQLGSARQLHSSGSLEPENSSSNPSLLITGQKTQNVEELSLDLIFYNNFWLNIKSFSKQNSKLRIYSKPDRNQSKLTVCSGCLPFSLAAFSCSRLLEELLLEEDSLEDDFEFELCDLLLEELLLLLLPVL